MLAQQPLQPVQSRHAFLSPCPPALSGISHQGLGGFHALSCLGELCRFEPR